jgi:hypothetical protein
MRLTHHRNMGLRANGTRANASEEDRNWRRSATSRPAPQITTARNPAFAIALYVHGRWPEVTIVTSGHTRVREDSLPTGAVFMPKPYDPALLPRCIKEMISSLPPSVGEARGFFADVSRRFVLPEPHVDDVPQEVIGRPRQVSRLRDKLRLDPMNAGKNEWEAEPG